MVDKIYDELKKVVDPELEFDVVALGLIYDVKIQDDQAIITMTLSTKSCPLHELMLGWVEEAGARVMPKCKVNLVWEPAWNIDMASDEVKKALM